mmetsp:Transcript_35715/g.70251  ORF Transcript_35715/g.70251 Transcript_35715/m.70251 type:complete len:286 (-) Transcript_35715:847-1704(-)
MVTVHAAASFGCSAPPSAAHGRISASACPGRTRPSASGGTAPMPAGSKRGRVISEVSPSISRICELGSSVASLSITTRRARRGRLRTGSCSGGGRETGVPAISRAGRDTSDAFRGVPGVTSDPPGVSGAGSSGSTRSGPSSSSPNSGSCVISGAPSTLRLERSSRSPDVSAELPALATSRSDTRRASAGVAGSNNDSSATAASASGSKGAHSSPPPAAVSAAGASPCVQAAASGGVLASLADATIHVVWEASPGTSASPSSSSAKGRAKASPATPPRPSGRPYSA